MEKTSKRIRNISVWYDKEGDYLELTLKKSKDTYFDEIRKDIAKIIDKRSNKVVGYAVFNFTKKKQQEKELIFPIPEEILN